MAEPTGVYLGAALRSFTRAVKSPRAVRTTLSEFGIDRIDPDRWYDLKAARGIYSTVGERIGPTSLRLVGQQIVHSGRFPPDIEGPESALASIDDAYRMNVRGQYLGDVKFTPLGHNRAELTFSTPFPCHLDQGIVEGCCLKFGAQPYVEHMPGECRDDGYRVCTYLVSWAR